jgi:hypothetical protein
MRIVRYRLGENERRAVGAIVHGIALLSPDAPIKPKGCEGSLVATDTRSEHETGYALDLVNYSAEVEVLNGLKNSLAQLTAEPAQAPIVVIENLPIERNAPALPLLVGSLIGEVREYHGHGAPIGAVSDKAAELSERPSSDNNLKFQLHTDMSFYSRPPTFIAFLMIRPASIGGESTFCDPLPIIERLPLHVVTQLRRPFIFPAPPHMRDLGPQWFPILDADNRGVLSVRYRGDGLRTVDSDQAHALAIWERDIASFEVEVPLERGEMVVFSNTQMLHGRRLFKDAGSDQKRLALRAYIEARPT